MDVGTRWYELLRRCGQLYGSVLPPCFSLGTCTSVVPLWPFFVPLSLSLYLYLFLSPMMSPWCFSALSSPHFPSPMAPPRYVVWCKLKEGPGRRQYSDDFCSFSLSEIDSMKFPMLPLFSSNKRKQQFCSIFVLFLSWWWSPLRVYITFKRVRVYLTRFLRNR